MSKDTKIGIVTAAGYTEAEKYYGRLHGLLDAVKASTILSPAQKQNLIIMGQYTPVNGTFLDIIQLTIP